MEVVELEGEDGSKLLLGENESGKAVVRGRGCGFNTNDRTVSRRHVSFQLNNTDSESAPRVSFEVIGRNPIWVCTNNNDDDNNGAIRVFRRSEKGELEFGDRFCLSAKAPVWFNLKKPTQPQPQLQEDGNKCEKNKQDEQVALTDPDSDTDSRGDLNFDDAFDVSGIDPVQEFGFVVMGHEFDHYPKGMIRNVKDWEWFLEEPSKDSEDEEDYFGKERRGKTRRKRKKGENSEDDEWTGESEDDKDLVANLGRGRIRKPGCYSTRSTDSKQGPNRDTKGSRNSKRKKVASVTETVEDEEEEDEDTLGGFIVDDEEDQEEENNEDEEEEFEEDDSGVEED